MVKKQLLIAFLFICTNSIFSFNSKHLDTVKKPPRIIDSLLLSDNLDWSVRLVSNFKRHQFRLRNNGNSLKYLPNNPFGFGIGIANQKLVIDIIFNIKNEEEDRQTEKFAMEGSFSHKKDFISFFVENVHGYNITNNFNDLENFRKDISIFSVGLNYLRLLNDNGFSVHQMKAGISPHKKTSFTFGLGGFLVTNHLNSKGSIIPKYASPYFNDEAQIKDLTIFGGGVSAGLFSYFALPANFFITLNLGPGIGLEYKEVTTETNTYVPTNPLLLKMDFFGALGYNGKRIYVHFNFGTGTYGTSLDYNNKLLFGVTKSKFIVGYRLGKK